VRQKFDGYERDNETGLDYAQARYFSNAQGRFTSPDSFFGRKTNPQTLNLYAYVLNNPLKWADPTGHFAQDPKSDSSDLINLGHLGHVEITDILPQKTPGLLSRIWGGLKKIGRAIGGAAKNATNDLLERDKHLRFPYFQHTDPNAPPPKIMRWGIVEPETLPALAAEVGEVAEGATVVEDVLAESGIRLSQKGLDLVGNHLEQFGDYAPNTAMMQRLNDAFSAGQKVTGADANFYLHEASEATMMGRGFSYDAAHAAAIEKYGVSPFSLYHPEVIQANPLMFNNAWRNYWNLPPKP
jgi:RHS repeat-associated protein